MKGLVDHVDIPDSVLQEQVYIFHYNPLDVKILSYVNPSLSPTGAQFSDRLDTLNGNYYLSKGNVGQSHYPLFVTKGDDIGLKIKPDINEGYSKNLRSINLFISQTPYSELAYSSSLNDDYQVSVSHAQNITPRWNVAFDYDLIAPEGVYASSSVTNHYLDFTTNYYSKDSRYQLQGGIIWQHFNMDESGGIAADSIFTQRLESNSAGIPVNLYDVVSKDKKLSAFVHQSFNTVRQLPRYNSHTELVAIDSIADSVVVVDTITPPAPMMFNTGVFGLDLSLESDTLADGPKQLWQHTSAMLFWTNDAYMNYRWHNPLKITLGVKSEHFKSDIDSLYKIEFASMTPLVKAELSTATRFSLVFNAEQRIATDARMSATHLSANATLSIDSLNSIFASASLQSTPADLIYFYHTPNNGADLQPVNVMKLEAGFKCGSMIDIAATARNIGHNTWIDAAGATVQAPGDMWLFQGRMNMNLALGHFHYDMQQLLQYSTDNEQLRVPFFASKNSLYFDITLFGRALRTQVGLDVRYHTAFYADSYQPIGGYFYRQNEVEVGNYFWGDVFVNLQVKRATIYVKAGHVNALWEMSPNYFILPHYPGQKFGLMYGVIWKFFD